MLHKFNLRIFENLTIDSDLIQIIIFVCEHIFEDDEIYQNLQGLYLKQKR